MNRELEYLQANLNSNKWKNKIADILISFLPFPFNNIFLELIKKNYFTEIQLKNLELFLNSLNTGPDVPNSILDDFDLINLKNAFEIIEKLKSNEKIKFLANLFNKSWSKSISQREYDEYVNILTRISYQDIEILKMLNDFESNFIGKTSPNFSEHQQVYYQKWNSYFLEPTASKLSISTDVLYAKLSILVSIGVCTTSGTGFLQSVPFYRTTDYFRIFIDSIS